MITISRLFRTFMRAEQGAVTVDWVVLAAAVVGLGVSSAVAVRTGVISLGGDIDSSLAGAMVASLGTNDATDAYTPFIATEDDIAYWMELFANEYSDEDLQNIYDNLQRGALEWMESDNPEQAQIYLDILYALDASMNDRDVDVPDGALAFDELLRRYTA